ncbi:sulfotransferase family 2 domain-containing protein [Pelagibacteraceae bacterium]|nr:sulfotransferase family 2 domain-containing protein [Pelagibacteraceae bacterium]
MKVNFKYIPSFNNNTSFSLNKSIFFMHIPKCGGTTLDHIFAKLSSILKNFKFERYTYKSETNKKFFYKATPNHAPSYITGHLDFNFTKNIENIFRCTIIREPTKRILSHYKFEVHMRNKTPKEYSFESFINDQINLNRDNLMTRHFAGLLNEKGPILYNHIETAKNNISLFDSIDIINNWDKFASNILTKFKMPSIIYSKYQKHEYKFSYDFSSDDLNLISKYFQCDIEIYNYIKQNNNGTNKDKNSIHNDKICIVSPYFEKNNKFYNEDEIRELINSKKTK